MQTFTSRSLLEIQSNVLVTKGLDHLMAFMRMEGILLLARSDPLNESWDLVQLSPDQSWDTMSECYPPANKTNVTSYPFKPERLTRKYTAGQKF